MSSAQEEGLELDLDFAASLEWGGRVDRLSSAIDKLRATAEASFDLHAIPLDLDKSAVVPASGPCLLDMGTPAVGRFWEVTALVVLGADDHTVIAGTFVSFNIGNTQVPSINNVILPGSQGGSAVTVPANAQFGRRQIVVQSPNHAYFQVYGATVGMTLYAGLLGWDRDVMEYPIR